MNKLSGHIEKVEVNGSLSLVSVKVGENLLLSAIVIDTPETATYLVKGNPVSIMFKETEVVIGTDEDHHISLQNRISGTVTSLEKGKLLSRVEVRTGVGDLVSIISTNAVEQLGIVENSAVVAMVKLNEMMLSE